MSMWDCSLCDNILSSGHVSLGVESINRLFPIGAVVRVLLRSVLFMSYPASWRLGFVYWQRNDEDTQWNPGILKAGFHWMSSSFLRVFWQRRKNHIRACWISGVQEKEWRTLEMYHLRTKCCSGVPACVSGLRVWVLTRAVLVIQLADMWRERETPLSVRMASGA